MSNDIIKGSIYKNRRRHPDRVFVVTKITAVKKGTYRTSRIYGLQIVDNGEPEELTYLLTQFGQEFPFAFWIPSHG